MLQVFWYVQKFESSGTEDIKSDDPRNHGQITNSYTKRLQKKGMK